MTKIKVGSPKPGIFRLGRCLVIVGIENDRWHLSISVNNASNILPNYKEIKEARYRYCPHDITMAEIFPPPDQFVNLAEVRHLWQIKNYEL